MGSTQISDINIATGLRAAYGWDGVLTLLTSQVSLTLISLYRTADLSSVPWLFNFTKLFCQKGEDAVKDLCNCDLLICARFGEFNLDVA